MENKLEQLLEKLLKLGRKPNGKEYNHIHAEANRIMSDFGTFYRFCNYVEDGSINRCLNLKLREIVSINSGLWQFVCNREHRFIDERNYDGVSLDRRLKNPYVDYDGVNTEYEWITCLDYQYWIIESSLKNESELEQFLLDNIKVGG